MAAGRDPVVDWLNDIAVSCTEAMRGIQFSMDSEYGRLGRWTHQEQNQLFDLASGSNQYAKDVLTPAMDSLAAIGASIERRLPFVEVALLRIVLESAGVVLWITRPDLTSRERLQRLVKCELAESFHQTRLLTDQANAGRDVTREQDEAVARAERANQWREQLGLREGAKMPDESDLIDLVTTDGAMVPPWLRTLLSSLIHSRVFAIDLVNHAARSQDSYQSDLGVGAGLSFLRAVEALAIFMMGDTFNDSAIETQVNRLRHGRP